MDLLLFIQEGLDCYRQMDFVDILLVPNFVITTSLDPRDWWDESETNAWTDWDLIDERRVISWQRCINAFFSKDNCTRSKWQKVFLVNSCMPELQKEIDKKYNKLKKCQKGGFIYLYYMFICLFTMTHEVKKDVLDWLAFCKTKGLVKVQCKNMTNTKLLLLGSCKKLTAVGKLHD